MNRKLREPSRFALGPAGLCLVLAVAVYGQAPAPGPKTGSTMAPSAAGTPMVPQAVGKPEASLAYVLAPDDQILVNILDLPEVDGKTYRIDLRRFCLRPPSSPDFPISPIPMTSPPTRAPSFGAIRFR